MNSLLEVTEPLFEVDQTVQAIHPVHGLYINTGAIVITRLHKLYCEYCMVKDKFLGTRTGWLYFLAPGIKPILYPEHYINLVTEPIPSIVLDSDSAYLVWAGKEARARAGL